jgi:hypothetical protein
MRKNAPEHGRKIWNGQGGVHVAHHRSQHELRVDGYGGAEGKAGKAASGLYLHIPFFPRWGMGQGQEHDDEKERLSQAGMKRRGPYGEPEQYREPADDPLQDDQSKSAPSEPANPGPRLNPRRPRGQNDRQKANGGRHHAVPMLIEHAALHGWHDFPERQWPVRDSQSGSRAGHHGSGNEQEQNGGDQGAGIHRQPCLTLRATCWVRNRGHHSLKRVGQQSHPATKRSSLADPKASCSRVRRGPSPHPLDISDLFGPAIRKNDNQYRLHDILRSGLHQGIRGGDGERRRLLSSSGPRSAHVDRIRTFRSGTRAAPPNEARRLTVHPRGMPPKHGGGGCSLMSSHPGNLWGIGLE